MNIKLAFLFAVAPMVCAQERCRAAEADQFSLDWAGGRFGFAATHEDRGFRSGEAFLGCNLPLSWDLGTSWRLNTRLDFTAGWLGRGGDDAVTSSIGPSVILKYDGLPLALEGGSCSILLSEHEFGTTDLGGPFQFRTYGGLNWDITKHWRAGYRFEHMSNAGIDKHNPGLNLHSFAFGYVF